MITSNPLLLSWIKGYKIPFDSLPFQASFPKKACESQKEKAETAKLIGEILEKGAIVPCEPIEGQFISDIFLVPKTDGSNRLILNLKKLNEFITTNHFKLEDRKTAINLINERCFMATIDLKDAYYAVSIIESDRRFLRFQFDQKFYEFTCLPFGLATAPYVFTKLLKPVVSKLRSQGYLSVIYLDDLLLIGPSFAECKENVDASLSMLRQVGFKSIIKKM